MTVSHNLLKHKLNIMGSQNSFLSNRRQCVVVEGETSDEVPVDSGVPQGSVLGNDIPEGLSSTVRLFADDTVVYMTITSGADTEKL